MIQEYIREIYRVHAGWRKSMQLVRTKTDKEAFPLPVAWRCVPYIAEEVGEYLGAYYASMDQEGQYTRRNDQKADQAEEELSHILMMCASLFLNLGLESTLSKYTETKSSETEYQPVVIRMLSTSATMMEKWEQADTSCAEEAMHIFAMTREAFVGRTDNEIVSIFAKSLANRKDMVARKHQWPE